jgi:cell fate regulator YaaT (PSP1 superfamily)
MPTIVGVRLRFSKTLWFDPAGTEPVEGDFVIVETERGIELGTVVQPPHEASAEAVPRALKPVLRVANEEDLEYAHELELKEREALPKFRELVEHYRLDMKPVAVEYVFDGDKIIFYFSADERVDFRELVKDLAAHFHARVDMRQIGVRDEARAVGGVGHCGQVLCCVRFGGDFQPVSIRMAKEQDLPLNPLKISGLCGRLMCCLRYEFDAYKDFKGRAPKKGAIIETAVGLAKVADFNTPRETVTMRFEGGDRVTVPLSGMTCGKGAGCPCSVDRDVLAEAGNAAAIAMATEEESAEAEPIFQTPAPQKRERDRGEKRERSATRAPEPSKGEQDKQAEPAAEKSGTPRRRRRRGGSGSGQSAGSETTQQAPRESVKPPSGGEGAGAASNGEQPSAGRKRRRRRRSGGGSGDAPAQA